MTIYRMLNRPRQIVQCLLLVAVSVLTAAAVTADPGGLASLRGVEELDDNRKADEFKRIPKDRTPYERDYLHQPPLIPHQVRGYKVDLNSNKCLSCHSWKNYKRTGATKISLTHFETRDGQQLSDVSPRRYFCMQCHVVQADARPLVDNAFVPVDALSD